MQMQISHQSLNFDEFRHETIFTSICLDVKMKYKLTASKLPETSQVFNAGQSFKNNGYITS